MRQLQAGRLMTKMALLRSPSQKPRAGARVPTTTPMVPVGGGGSHASTPSQPAGSRAASPGSADVTAPPSSSGVCRTSLFWAPLQTRGAPVVVPPRVLTFRVVHGGAAVNNAGLAGERSLTRAATKSPSKPTKGVRKQAKPRVKRTSKKTVTPQLADGPAGGPVRVSDGPPTAASQNGASPLAVPPLVH